MAYYHKECITGDSLISYTVGDIVSVLMNDLRLYTGRISVIGKDIFTLDCSKEFNCDMQLICYKDVKCINLFFGDDSD